MTIGTFCRDFRQSNNVPLSKLVDKSEYKTVYSFETGRSTNVNHLRHYMKLADNIAKSDIFLVGLIKELRSDK